MKTPRLLAHAAIAVIAVMGLASCSSNLSGGGDTPSGEAEGPITIGVLVDQTAYLKTVDAGVLDGINAAIKSINDDGGVLGRDLAVVVADTAADPQTQVQSFQKVESQNEPVLFINGFSSAGNAATAPIAQAAGIPMIVSSVVPVDDPEWVFSTITPARYETGIRVDYIKELGVKSVAVLHDPTPYNKALLETLSAQLTEAGMTLTGAEEHASDAVDLAPQVAKLLSGNPEALIKLSAGPTQIVAAKALADAGSSIPYLLGIDSRANLVQATAVYDHVYFAAAPLQVAGELKADEKSAAIDRFLEVNPDLQDPTYVGRGWDAVYIAAMAIEEAGSTDGDAIRQALVDMGPYEGTSGSYDYTDDDHYGITVNPDYIGHFDGDVAKIIFRPEGR